MLQVDSWIQPATLSPPSLLSFLGVSVVDLVGGSCVVTAIEVQSVGVWVAVGLMDAETEMVGSAEALLVAVMLVFISNDVAVSMTVDRVQEGDTVGVDVR